MHTHAQARTHGGMSWWTNVIGVNSFQVVLHHIPGEASIRSQKGRRDRWSKQCTLVHTRKHTPTISAEHYRRRGRWGCSHGGGVHRACGDSRVVGGSAGSRSCAAERNDSQLRFAADPLRRSSVSKMRLVACGLSIPLASRLELLKKEKKEKRNLWFYFGFGTVTVHCLRIWTLDAGLK